MANWDSTLLAEMDHSMLAFYTDCCGFTEGKSLGVVSSNDQIGQMMIVDHNKL